MGESESTEWMNKSENVLKRTLTHTTATALFRLLCVCMCALTYSQPNMTLTLFTDSTAQTIPKGAHISY